MRSPDDPECPFALELSQHEHESLEWLLKVCEKVSQNPKSCNRTKATLAARAIEKMRDQLHDSHAQLHILEERSVAQSRELSENYFTAFAAKRMTGSEGAN